MKINYLIIPIFLGIFIACSPKTQVTASWKNENVQQQYSNLFIAALSEDLALRQSIENEFASRLANRDVKTQKSIESLTPDFFESNEPSKEKIMEAIELGQSDGILTIALINVEEEERWVPGGGGMMGGPMFAPMGRFGYYGNLMGYYNHWYGAGWNQGYYARDKKYFMETNLYDAESLELVWSAQSRTVNPSDIMDFSKEYVDILKAEMRREGLIR